MSVPSVFISLMIATVCGLGFHLIRGGSLPRLGLYIATAWVAFFVGHFVGSWLGWDFLQLGVLNLFPALLATLLGLLAASILAGPERKSIPPQKKGKTRFKD
jgi:flagellar motor component MotA